MDTRKKAKIVLAVILSAIAILGVVSWQKVQAQQKYTAEEVSNLVFDDAAYILRTVFVNSLFTQINNRRYQMDEIFNMVYDDVNHSLRVTVLADSAHEFHSLWADTVLAKLYASKDGACIYFWMRGIHGDTLAKFEDRHHNIMATLDTTGEWKAYGYKFFTWTNANNPPDSLKLWARHDTLFWNDAVGVPQRLYPAATGGTAFGDTNAYYVGTSFGIVRDSVGGHYFNKIQAAINQAYNDGASNTNRKTVYILEGTYLEPCTTKNYVNIVGMGKKSTLLTFNPSNYYVGTGSNFTIDNLTMKFTAQIMGGDLTLKFSVSGSGRVEYRNVDVVSENDAMGTCNKIVVSSTTNDTLLFDNCDIGMVANNWSTAYSGSVNLEDTMTGTNPYQRFSKVRKRGTTVTTPFNRRGFAIYSTCGDGSTSGNINFEDCIISDYYKNTITLENGYVSVNLEVTLTHCTLYGSPYGGNYSLYINTASGFNRFYARSCDFHGRVYIRDTGGQNYFYPDGGCHMGSYDTGADYPVIYSSGSAWPDTCGIIHWQESFYRIPFGMHNEAMDTIMGKAPSPHEGWDAFTSRSGGAGSDTFWIYGNGQWNAVWPPTSAPLGVGSFGDTNAYYASVASFGAGRDSIGGYYFSGSNAIQAALNAAATAATITNKKTVYVMEGLYAQSCSLRSNVNLVGSGMQITVIKVGKGGNKIFTARGASNFTVRDLSIVCDSATAGNLYDSLATSGCKNVLYYNFMQYSSELLASNDMVGIIKTSAGDSVQLINCMFGLGTRLTTGSRCWSAITVMMDGGIVVMDNVKQNTSIQVFGMTVTKTGGIIDVTNSSFAARGPNGTAVILDDDQASGTNYFYNCVFNGNGVDNAFYNTGVGYGATVNVHGSTFYGRYFPSIGAQQFNNVSGKMFYCATNPMLQAGWGTSSWYQVNIEWSGAANAGEYSSFKYGSVEFDTVNGLSTVPHAGYLQYKANASPNDTSYLWMDGGWRNLDRTWSTGRDSVLVNQASDTLAVTGIQTTSFVEINLESDPGVNIGCPYHTKTANQDILVWPVACVNKFYYRWRIH